MQPDEYQAKANVFEMPEGEYKALHDKFKIFALPLIHHTLGVAGEAGELVDATKRWLFYGKDLDYDNMEEEIGDILWYLAGLCNLLDLSMEDIMKKNLTKLGKRYPNNAFSPKDALERKDKIDELQQISVVYRDDY